MIPAGRDEILSRFAGISAVLWILHKLYLAIICEKFDHGKAAFFVLPGSFTGAKLFHGIVSARLSRTKKLYTSVWKNLLKYILYWFQIVLISIVFIQRGWRQSVRKKVDKCLYRISSFCGHFKINGHLWVLINKFHLARMEIDFPM